MSVKAEFQAWWFTFLAQLLGSKYYALRARGMKPQQARIRMFRDAVSLTMRFKVLKRDRFTCTKCGRTPPFTRLEVDHILPLSKGGTNKESNLETLCYRCNRGKGAKT